MPACRKRLTMMVPLLLMASCINTASREECEQACKHLRQLQQATGPGTDGGQTEGSAGLKRQLNALQKELIAELSRLETEQEGLQAKAESDEERERIKEKYERRLDAKQKEYQPKFEQIREQIDEAHDSAKEPSSEKKQVAVLKDAQAISDCADQCLESETGKGKITCRMRATSQEEFKACR